MNAKTAVARRIHALCLERNIARSTRREWKQSRNGPLLFVPTVIWWSTAIISVGLTGIVQKAIFHQVL